MKTQVKYVTQDGQSGKLTPVYMDTTIPGFRHQAFSNRLYSRLAVGIALLALVSCAALIGFLLAGNSSKDAEITLLQQKLEAQQTRLHRMNKELQFLMTRHQAYEAREESEKRRSGAFIPEFISKINSDNDSSKEVDDDWLTNEEEIDVDQLPIASANKKRSQGKF